MRAQGQHGVNTAFSKIRGGEITTAFLIGALVGGGLVIVLGPGNASFFPDGFLSRIAQQRCPDPVLLGLRCFGFGWNVGLSSYRLKRGGTNFEASNAIANCPYQIANCAYCT